MKRLILLGIIFIGIGAFTMTEYCKSNELEFKKYIPKDPLFDLTFEYPQGWNVFERRGSYGSFIQAQIVEPPETTATTKKLACSISITIYPQSKAEFTPLSAQGLTEDIRKKRLSLKGSNLLSSSETNIAGLKASDEKFAYSKFKLPLQVDAKAIPVIERVICFQKGDNYYTISLDETIEHFEAYNDVFNRILNSLQFRNE